jgi:hypothetical protein
LPNPRITIETYLEKIQPQNIVAIQNQLKQASTGFNAMQRSSSGASSTIVRDMDMVANALKNGNRELAINSIRYLTMGQRFETFSQAMKAFKIHITDAITPVGMLNNVMSIMMSRFGMMIIAFAAVQALQRFTQAMKDAARETDTAVRRIQAVVIPTFGSVENATSVLTLKMMNMATQYGASINEISNSMFFLSSAGRTHVQVLNEIDAAQKLVVAGSKDMKITQDENKVIVETFVGLLNVYGESIKKNATEQERATHLANTMFAVFKKEQILIPELAAGLKYAALQAKLLNISSEELLQSVGYLNTVMLKGSTAGTSYANALRDTIRNSGKLKELFNIDVSRIGDSFSFLEKVVKPVTEDLKRMGDAGAAMGKLMQVYNIRSTRAMLGLGVAVDQNIARVKELTKGTKDLDFAFNTVNDSVVSQEQRFKNLKQLFMQFNTTVLTAGIGQAKILQTVNDIIEYQVRNLAQLSAYFTRISATLLFISKIYSRGFLSQFAEFDKRAVDDLNLKVKVVPFLPIKVDASVALMIAQIGKEVKDYRKGLEAAKLLLEFSSGQISEIQLKQEMINKGILKQNDNIEEQIGYLRQVASSYKSITSNLSGELAIFSKILGRAIQTEDLLANLRGNRELVGDILGQALFVSIAAEKISTSMDEVTKSFIGETKSLSDFATKARALHGMGGWGEIVSINKDAITSLSDFSNIADRVNKLGKERLNNWKLETDLISNMPGFLENLGRTFDRLFSSYKRSPQELINFLEEEFAAKIIDINSKLDTETAKINTETIEGQKALAMAETVATAEAAKAFLDKEIAKRKILQDSYDAQFKIIKDSNDKVQKYFHDRAKLIDVMINNQPAIDFMKSNARLSEIMSVSIIPKKLDIDKFKDIAELEKSLMEKVMMDIELAGTASIKRRSDANTAYITETIGKEYMGMLKVTGFFDTMAGSYEVISKHKRNTILDNVDFEMKNIEKVAEEYAKSYKVELQEYKKAINEREDETLKSIRSLEARKTTGTFSDIDQIQLDRLKEEYQSLRDQGISVMADLTRSATMTTDEWTKRFAEYLKSRVSDSINKANDDLRALIETEREAKRIISDEIRLYGEFTSTVSDIFGNLATLAQDHDNRVLKSISSVGSSLARGITAWADYSQSAKTAMDQANLSLSIFNLILLTANAIIDIFSKEERKKTTLEPEFLASQDARTVSPDYGQARVINNRITLAPVFQLLDPSQLSSDVQRRIANELIDEIQELLKANG